MTTGHHTSSHVFSLLAGLSLVIALTNGLRPARAGDAPAPALPREAGLWYDDTGRGAVEIVPCGDRLCGRIAWLKEEINAEGKPLSDRHNPDPAKRSQLICGLQIMGQLRPMTDGSWDQGWIYDPKTGSAYDAAIAMVAEGQLKVTGYKGIKLLSKSFVWNRAPDDLPRCSQLAGAAAPLEPAQAQK